MDSNLTATKNNDFILVEKVGDNLELPVGSVLTIDGQRVLYRDIRQKHIFKKGSWQAIATDDLVINYLTNNDNITYSYFYNKDTHQLLKTKFDRYKEAKPIKMRGRLQKFVGLASFEVSDLQEPLPRPTQKLII
jgi:hypothetical protein